MSVFDGWGDLWSVMTGAEQRRGEELDRRLAELNRDALESNRWTQEQFNAAEANRLDGATGNTRGEVIEAAAEGAVEGLVSLPDNVRRGVDGAARWTLSAVPWWAWIVGGVALFVYLGGGAVVRAQLARYAR